MEVSSTNANVKQVTKKGLCPKLSINVQPFLVDKERNELRVVVAGVHEPAGQIRP